MLEFVFGLVVGGIAGVFVGGVLMICLAAEAHQDFKKTIEQKADERIKFEIAKANFEANDRSGGLRKSTQGTATKDSRAEDTTGMAE